MSCLAQGRRRRDSIAVSAGMDGRVLVWNVSAGCAGKRAGSANCAPALEGVIPAHVGCAEPEIYSVACFQVRETAAVLRVPILLPAFAAPLLTEMLTHTTAATVCDSRSRTQPPSTAQLARDGARTARAAAVATGSGVARRKHAKKKTKKATGLEALMARGSGRGGRLVERLARPVVFTGGNGGVLRAHCLETTHLVATLGGAGGHDEEDAVTALAVVGCTLFSGSEDRSICMWDLVPLCDPAAVAFGETLALRPVLRVRGAHGATVRCLLPLPSGLGRSVAGGAVTDGPLLLSCGFDGRVRVWRCREGPRHDVRELKAAAAAAAAGLVAECKEGDEGVAGEKEGEQGGEKEGRKEEKHHEESKGEDGRSVGGAVAEAKDGADGAMDKVDKAEEKGDGGGWQLELVQERQREEEFRCLGYQHDANADSHNVLCGTEGGCVLMFPLDLTKLG